MIVVLVACGFVLWWLALQLQRLVGFQTLVVHLDHRKLVQALQLYP
mgnify:CR=1 FL=1